MLDIEDDDYSIEKPVPSAVIAIKNEEEEVESRNEESRETVSN